MVKSLIEQWFPAAVVGAESMRERGAASALPPINFLHVWWARRPLAASRAAIVASVLPAWLTEDDDADAASIGEALEHEFPGGFSDYHAWFLKIIGIMGDSFTARQHLRSAREKGIRLEGNGYGYKRAFTVTPSEHDIEKLKRLIALRTKSGTTTVVDPFSGGGSIPFETLRYGMSTIANELNPVAAAILEGTITLPARFGPALAADIELYGKRWASAAAKRLGEAFPKPDKTDTISYIWAHTVPCPTTGLATPLCPNLWLANTAGSQIALALEPNRATSTIDTEIVTGEAAIPFGERATYKQGNGISVWTNEPFDGDYIRGCAQSGTMGHMMLAVSYTTGRGREFRVPSYDDLHGIDVARGRLESSLSQWESADLVPDEVRFIGPADRAAQYGIKTMRDMYSDRQLLVNVTLLEELLQVSADACLEQGRERGKAIALYLSLALGKCVNYNSRLASWDPTRLKIRSTFDRHDFSFKWTFAEFDGAFALAPWAVDQISEAYSAISALSSTNGPLFDHVTSADSAVVVGSATELPLADRSVDAIITDPPYYDNVMYAECADFFYVWSKRSLRETWPELCKLRLTDKEREAVANAALFKDVATHRGSGKRRSDSKTAAELADERYELLLTDSFKEAHRVLKDDGVMTVMFTHKRVDAWDTLGMALLESGFRIESSWPVHTESEHSLHQAKKNSASSTILLTCRKRQGTQPAFWTDIRAEIERAVEDAVARFSAEGMVGVDLTLATYGPALSVLSRNWPVYTGDTDASGTPLVIRPDIALDLAREKVAGIKKRGLLGGRQVEFDRPTDWWLLAWSDFQAREFPSGEALKLSIATHLNLDDLAKRHRLLGATSGSVSILTPQQRRAAKAVVPEAKSYTTYVDALHTFMLVYDEDGLGAARAWLARTGYADDAKFHDLVRAALYAVPRTRAKDKFVLPEAQTLESIRANIFEDIAAPQGDVEQLALARA
jgi:putative DNA methylase